MRAFLKRLVLNAPESVVELARVAYDIVPCSMRYGKPYRNVLSLLAKSEHWDLTALIAYQETMLRRLLNHCYTSVPYYREVFNNLRLKPVDIRTLADLKALPYLTKEIVRKRKRDLIATDFSVLERDNETTGGSSGTPLDFYVDNTTRAMEMALLLRHLLWLNYRAGDNIAEIKEDSFNDPDRICRFFPGSRHLRFAFFRVDEAKLKKMVDALEAFRPAFIKAYPSSLFVLSRWMQRNGRKIPAPRYIITSSEALYPSIKEQAEACFHAPVIDWYGQNEKVATAFQCSLARGYHIQMEQAIVEFMPCGGEECEIVGTSIQSFGMPFIRYRTADLGVMCSEPCPCGRKHPVITRITGREGEFIVTPERNIIAPVAMDYAFYHLDEIKEGQIVQEDIRTLTIKVVPWENISDSTKGRLLTEIKSYLRSPTMKVNIEEVEEIPRTRVGKRPFIISRIKIDDYV